MQISLFTLALAGAATVLATPSADMSMPMATETSTPTAKEALATTSTPSAAKPTGSSSSKPIVHTVMVGQSGLHFTPSVIQASPGHMVEFIFHPANHSVAQAAFDAPCMPMASSASMKSMAGFYSGFKPVANETAKKEKFTVMVNSTSPMWFYCSQAKHCQSGMVGVINPSNASGMTVEAFAGAAAKAGANVSPERVGGGCGAEMMGGSGVASTSGKASTKAAAAAATGKKGNGTAVATTAASSAKTTAAAGAVVAASASASSKVNGTGITQSNQGNGWHGQLSLGFGSSVGLLGLLAGSLVLFA